MNRRFEITDDGWERLAPLLPERLMNRRKQFRAATRYDKLACRYAATVCVADIFIWLRAQPDQPRR